MVAVGVLVVLEGLESGNSWIGEDMGGAEQIYGGIEDYADSRN